MPSAFEWDIEEQSGPPRRIREGGNLPNPRRRRLIRAVLLLVLLAVMGLGVRAWISSRLDEVEEAEQALREVVALELKSIADGDTEIFRARQDPQDPIWQERQIGRYFSDRADRFTPAPGLEPVNRGPEIAELEFSGRAARVQLVRWFQEPDNHPTEEHPEPSGNPSSRPLPFNTPWFYREDKDGNWYHVAPPDDFLGVPYSWHGRWLDVRATEVEAKALDPVASDVIILVSQVCLWIGCPEDVRYTLSFEDTLAPEIQGTRWTVPALYLTGLPRDEGASDGLGRTLEVWVLGPLAQAQFEGESLTQRIMYRQLVARLAAELGLVESVPPDAALIRQVLVEGGPLALRDLWVAEVDPSKPDEMRVLEAEVEALLGFLEEKTGAAPVFRLLPALGTYDRLEDALATLFNLELESFTADWSAYLANLTGATALTSQNQDASTFGREEGLPPPPTPAPLSTPAGEHIAFICGGRIWTSDADGSQLVPLTLREDQFKYLHWSPDGRWLLTTWQPPVSGASNLLYLLAADGRDARLLPNDSPAAQVLPLGWSPDGGEVIYAMWHKTATFPMDVRSMDIETGETRVLPGVPYWSPEGDHLSYVTESYGSAWVAGGDWDDARAIADRAWAAFHGGNWSPDGSRVAFQLDEPGRAESAIAVFDLRTESLTKLIDSAGLTSALQSYTGRTTINREAASTLSDIPLRWLWPFGWSADGSQMLVWAHRSDRTATSNDLSVLVVLPLDGSEPRPLGYFSGSSLSSAAWSPTHPNLVAFTWLPQIGGDQGPTTYLFDLDSGLRYFNTWSRGAAWSPDGDWVALNGPDSIAIVDWVVRARHTLQPAGGQSCSDVVWNPQADLSQLRESAVRSSQPSSDTASQTITSFR